MHPRHARAHRTGARVASAAAAWLGLSGCYPGETPVSDIVATLHDTKKDFRTYQTFTLPDSVVDAGDPSDPGYIEVTHEYDDEILAGIRQNLTALGWVEIPEDQLSPTNVADVAVLVTMIITETTQIWYYPPYWGWWPGWGYYPPYYPGWIYPCCYSVSQYTTGTISIDMAALVDADPATETVPIPWAARLNGLANRSSATQARIETAIDQAFAQSPYLDIQ